MALAGGVALLRLAAGGLRGPGSLLWAQHSRDATATPTTSLPPQAPLRFCSRQDAPQPPPAPPSPYQEQPWEYLESEEYHLLYGASPVWLGYRRNHKGAVPPQRTRKACLRRGKRVGNPCPICRDPNLHVHFRNVKLLDQFICPHSGVILHPTHTGVCMKQHKLLTKAIEQAQDHGLLWLQVPYVPVPREDFSNQHPAIGRTPPAPALAPGSYWYPWYEWQQPPAAAVARLRRLYKGFLKEEARPDAPPAPSAEPKGE
ncbi:28S ribosomal protein S18b, mitochondrial [Dryobates pubescens]|uniref:28S ribosomal protein S18b, mitochondrial n=1 Tax=Dryobates pubescens TaxID=118200 RepID=UPI0023B8F716|nr:28S ribosomal protein S18b, mitochondrial [Dryobates pubescens]